MHPKTIFEHFTLKVWKSKSSETFSLVFKFSSCVDAPHTLTSSIHANQKYIFHSIHKQTYDYAGKMQLIHFCIFICYLENSCCFNQKLKHILMSFVKILDSRMKVIIISVTFWSAVRFKKEHWCLKRLIYNLFLLAFVHSFEYK